MVGKIISHYQILEKIGEGGMGVVYKAEDTKLHRTVALKFLRPEAVGSREMKARFFNEAEAAAALDHPNICTVYEIDEVKGQAFIAMALVEGESVAEKVKSRPLPIGEALRIGVNLAEGLEAAHEKGVVHRDIKPANVMIDSKGRVKITDFGLAHLDEATKITKTGTSLGTPAYMSPEQVRGEAVDRRTDIWSLGVVLYEMITGLLPFRGEVRESVSHSILYDEPEPLTAMRTGVPRELERMVSKAMKKLPEERYQHVDELLVDLREVEHVVESATGTSAAPPSGGRRSTLLAALVALAVVVAGGLALYLWPDRRSADTRFEESLVPVPLTSERGREQHPSFYPDGGQVAYSWNGKDQLNADIYIKLVDSLSSTRLTTDPAPDEYPSFSPDGRSIAFVRRYTGSHSALILIPAIGGLERVLCEGYFRKGRLSWFPDSEAVVVSRRDSLREPSALFLVSTETGEMQRLTSPPHDSNGDRDAVISPDGGTLVYSRAAHWAIEDLYRLPLSSDRKPMGEPVRISFFEQFVSGPAWTADGREIVFVSRSGGSSGLWRIPADGSGEPYRMTFAGASVDDVAISVKGNRLAYTEKSEDWNIWRLELPGPLNAPQATVGVPEPFIASTRYELGPAYSPDGKRIAYSSNISGTPAILVCDADGSNAIEVFSKEGARCGGASWSPDAMRLAFNVDEAGQSDIYVVSANGSNLTRLTNHPATEDIPSWSRDGRWVYFFSERSGEGRLWKIPVSVDGRAGQASQVTKGVGDVGFEAGDGSVFFQRFTTIDSRGTMLASLWRLPSGGGLESEVVPTMVRRNFAVVDRGVYFMSPPDKPDESSLVRFLSLKTGDTTTLARIPGVRVNTGMSVSPDGRFLLYVQQDVSGSDLKLVENFQ